VLDDVMMYLRCPKCGAGLARAKGSVRCPAGHAFDIAREGYVNLVLAGTTRNAGDTAAMVQARRDFLAAGHFAWLATALADRAAPARRVSGLVIDVGAGTGYYLASVLDRLPRHHGAALDIARPALRVAARAHPRAAAIGCDAWQPLPIAQGAADLALNVFAPRDGAQLRTALHPDGSLLVVTPAPGHLGELIGPLELLTVDERKPERLAAKLGPFFDLASESELGRSVRLGRAAIAAVTAMGPSSWHARPASLAARIERLPERVAVTLAVRLSVFRPRAPDSPP
jgi:23S rRNA (guanine745-N1)-methyltransferase